MSKIITEHVQAKILSYRSEAARQHWVGLSCHKNFGVPPSPDTIKLFTEAKLFNGCRKYGSYIPKLLGCVPARQPDLLLVVIQGGPKKRGQRVSLQIF